MIVDIQHSIIKQLKTNFPDHKVYGEKVEQGLVRPCFFVDILPITFEKINPEMQSQLVTVDIQYMSQEDTKAKNLEMASQLPQIFSYIELPDGKKIRITNEQFETIDGILHYLFDLDFIVKMNVDEGLPMIGQLNLNEEVE
jgi:hypothetical protein